MSIAQHFVAGEGTVHPLVEQTSVTHDDEKALIQFDCDTTNLPWIIFRAAFRAEHLAGLPARSRALLATLARTIDAGHPYAAIFARRELLTCRAMQSMRTFYRSLDDLETAGLIVRPPQRRYGEAGLFGRAYLHLTEKAARLLGLVEPTPSAVIDPEPTLHDEKEPDAAALSQRPASLADGAIYKDPSPTAFQKRQPGQLPADLHRLRALGFHAFLIFRLMREARQYGKRLSDVVDVVWDHLKAARHPINYLRKLLKTPTDFQMQRAVRKRAIEAARQAELDAEVIRTTLTRCMNGIFLNPAATCRITIVADHATMHNAREERPRTMAGAWQAGFVNALRAGQLVPATKTLEAQFASRRRMAQAERASVITSSPAWVMTAAAGEQLQQIRYLVRCASVSRLSLAA